MAAIMEFTQFDNAVDETGKVKMVTYQSSFPGVLRVYVYGSKYLFRPGDRVTYKNNGVSFTGTVKGQTTGSSYSNGVKTPLYITHVTHPNAESFKTIQGGTIALATQVEQKKSAPALVGGESNVTLPDAGVTEQEGMPTPGPKMASIVPEGIDVKKVGIGLGILAIAYYIFKGKK